VRSDSIYSNRMKTETGCQRRPTEPLGLSLSERAIWNSLRATDLSATQASRSNTWDFYQTEWGLTAPRPGEIARARKKGSLNFLFYIDIIGTRLGGRINGKHN
jgi:hypothetical protein